MIGTSRLDPEKRVCLSAESEKDMQQATSSASNDGNEIAEKKLKNDENTDATKGKQLPRTGKKKAAGMTVYTGEALARMFGVNSSSKKQAITELVVQKPELTSADMTKLYESSEYAIEKNEINTELTGKALVQKLEENEMIKPSKVKVPKPPPKEPIVKPTGTINGRSWAEVTAESEKKEEQKQQKGVMNTKHAERSRRTFIIRRAPYNYQPEELLEALDEQFTEDLGEVGERLESLTRDKYDKRRLYVTFKQYEDKKTVAQRGFKIGNVTIPGEPGDVSGLITDVPHYLDLDDMTELLAPYGTIIRHRFRTYNNTQIRKGTYDFDLQLHEGKHIPTELTIYNDTMTVLDKNQRKLCTYCNRYGHLSSYCRKRMDKEMERRQDGAEQTTAIVDGSTMVDETVTEIETVAEAGVAGGVAEAVAETETDFVAEVVTEVVADTTAEAVTDVAAEVVVDATAGGTTAVTNETLIDDAAETEDGQRAGSDDHMDMSDEANMTEREVTSEDEDVDDVELETVRKRTTEDDDLEAKKKRLKKREELRTKDEGRETRREAAINKEEQEYKEKVKRYHARKEMEEKKKREQEEEDKKKSQKEKERQVKESDETLNIDQECRRLEAKLNTGLACNGSREYTTLSSTPIPNKNWVKQAWTPKSKNPSVEIPLRKISKSTHFPEEEIGAYNSVTSNIVRVAHSMFRTNGFNLETVIELSKCRTKLHVTFTNPNKNARIRNLQMRAFIGIIDSICEQGEFG